MHRLDGSEDGYSHRYSLARHSICLKQEFLDFFKRMELDEFPIPNEERLLLANVDAALDELLHVYHKHLIDQEYDTKDTTLFCKLCDEE